MDTWYMPRAPMAVKGTNLTFVGSISIQGNIAGYNCGVYFDDESSMFVVDSNRKQEKGEFFFSVPLSNDFLDTHSHEQIQQVLNVCAVMAENANNPEIFSDDFSS